MLKIACNRTASTNQYIKIIRLDWINFYAERQQCSNVNYA